MRDYFPEIHAAIDWSVEVEWLDKEIAQVLHQAGQRSRHVDVLANVRLLDGSEQWLLLHLEVQTTYESGFEFRIACYNAGLLSGFRKRVVTLVILADLRKSWKPKEDNFKFASFSSRLRFPVCKFLDRLRTDWKDGKSLPIQLARAQIEALRTAGDPERRLEIKWKLVRSLYDLGYDADELRRIFRWIDRMMQLRSDLEAAFKIRLTDFEKEQTVPYLTSLERSWLAEGRAEGEARGEAHGVAKSAILVLSRLCGELPAELQSRIHSLPVEAAEQLVSDAIEMRKLADVEAWLAEHAVPTE